MKFTFKTHCAPVVACALIIFTIGLARSGAGPVFAKAADKSGDAKLELVWSRRTPMPLFLSSAPDAKVTVSVAAGGSLTCFGPSGGILWKTRIDRVDRVAVAPDGSALAYTLLSPRDDTVYFISPNGTLLWKRQLRGAVWCADAAAEPGRFVVGTGAKYCYVFNVLESRRRYRRWKTPGVPTSVVFAPDSNTIILGTWQDSGVGRFSSSGEKIAWWAGREDMLYRTESSGGGQSIVAFGTRNTNRSESSVRVMDKELNEVWSRDFDLRGLALDVSAESELTGVGYKETIVHKNKKISENRIAIYDRSGRQLWEKGGLFGQWNLMQVCSSGKLLLFDDSGAMCLVNREGRVVVRTELAGTVKTFLPGPKRDTVTLYLSNGELCVYKIL